jgi:hypothetical protein
MRLRLYIVSGKTFDNANLHLCGYFAFSDLTLEQVSVRRVCYNTDEVALKRRKTDQFNGCLKTFCRSLLVGAALEFVDPCALRTHL